MRFGLPAPAGDSLLHSSPVTPEAADSTFLLRVREGLLQFGATIPTVDLFPSAIGAAATEFALSDPFAFALATCLDRQTPSGVIWTIPYVLRKALDHLEPARIAQMDDADLAAAFAAL